MPIRNLLPSVWRRSEVPVLREEGDPFSALRREMNRIFDDFYRGFDLVPFAGAEERLGFFTPAVDVVEGKKDITVKVELPGLDEKDVEVLLSDDVLTIRGEKKQEKEESTGDYYRMERTYGRFERAIPLPENVDPAGIEAKFKKGVLSIQMPKRAEIEDKAKKIEIKAE